MNEYDGLPESWALRPRYEAWQRGEHVALAMLGTDKHEKLAKEAAAAKVAFVAAAIRHAEVEPLASRDTSLGGTA